MSHQVPIRSESVIRERDQNDVADTGTCNLRLATCDTCHRLSPTCALLHYPSQPRSEGLERALSTVVGNGLRVGWIELGHTDSEVLNLLGQLPGQPLALRTADGGDNDGSAGVSADVDVEEPEVEVQARPVMPVEPGPGEVVPVAAAT